MYTPTHAYLYVCVCVCVCIDKYYITRHQTPSEAATRQMQLFFFFFFLVLGNAQTHPHTPQTRAHTQIDSHRLSFANIYSYFPNRFTYIYIYIDTHRQSEYDDVPPEVIKKKKNVIYIYIVMF